MAKRPWRMAGSRSGTSAPISMRAAGLMGSPGTMRPRDLRSSLTGSSSTPSTRGGSRASRATGSIDLQWGGPGAPTNLMNTPSGNAAASRVSRPGAINPGYSPTPGNQKPTGPGYKGGDGIWYGKTPGRPEYQPPNRPGYDPQNPGTPLPGSPDAGYQGPDYSFPGGGGGPGALPSPGVPGSGGPLPGMNNPMPPGSSPFPTATPPGGTAGYPGQNPPTGPLPFPTGPGSPGNPGGMPGSTAGGPMGQPGFNWPTPPIFNQGLGGDPTVGGGMGGGMGGMGGNSQAVMDPYWRPGGGFYTGFNPGYHSVTGWNNAGFGGGLAGSMGSNNSWADPNQFRQGVLPGNPMTGGGFQAPGGWNWGW